MDRRFFFDLERAAFGTLDVELQGPADTCVKVAVGECAEDGTLNRNPGGSRCFKEIPIHLRQGQHLYPVLFPAFRSGNRATPGLTSPLDREVAPFRYVEINGDLQTAAVHRHELFPEFDDTAAHFSSSNKALDAVWELCHYTMKATAAFGIFIDGERERMPYEGDTYINQLGWFCTSNDGTIPRKTINFLLQTPTWPQEWRLLMPIIAEDYLLYTGDSASIQQWHDTLEQRLMRHYWNEQGLLLAQTDDICNLTKIKTIVDWPKSEQDNCEFGPVMFVSNCYLYGALLAMYRLYGTPQYLHEAENVKIQLRRQMLRGNLFLDIPGGTHSSIHSLMFAITFGIADKKEIPYLASEIASRGMACSVYGAQFLLEALYRSHRPQDALALMCSNGPRSWLAMLNAGTTIAMEAWSNECKPNQDWTHAWGAAPANIIPRWLCGIRPISAGFRKIIIDPQPGALEHFILRHPTPMGSREMSFKDGRLEVFLPEGMTALYRGQEYQEHFLAHLDKDNGQMP